jgi:spermidine synthase
MKNFIYNEMMVHVPLCTSKDPKKVLIISDDASDLVNEVAKHSEIESETIIATLDALRGAKDAEFDVVISELNADAAGYAHLNRVLKSDGLLVTTNPSLDEVQENTKIMEILGKYMKIIMPYRVSEGKMVLLASKEYHPTADIILQRSDMLDNLNYYNCDVHPAAFAMGNNIRKDYLGIIKN